MTVKHQIDQRCIRRREIEGIQCSISQYICHVIL